MLANFSLPRCRPLAQQSPKGVHASPEPTHQQPGYGSRGADRAGDSWLASSGGGGSFGTPSRGYSGGSSSVGGGLPSPGSSRFDTGGLFDRSVQLPFSLLASSH
jgi:hypothetical protein